MDEKGVEMQEELDETLAGLTDKLGRMEQQVSGAAKTVRDSVNNVRDSFDIGHHARRRPWTLIAGASAVGFASGYRSRRVGAIHPVSDTRNSTKPARTAAIQANTPENGGGGGICAPHATLHTSPGILASMGERFEPELTELRGLVVGTLLGIAREVIINQARRKPEEPGGEEPDGRRSRPME